VIQIVQFTIQRTYLSGGTEDLFPIGFISFTGWEWNINAKSAEILPTGEEKHSRIISKVGDIATE